MAVSRLTGAAAAGEVRLVARDRPLPAVVPVHPREAEQVARIRRYRMQVGGKTYHIYRGDIHRHTDISVDGMGDGSLMDLHRYAVDAAALDYVFITDHTHNHARAQRLDVRHDVQGREVIHALELQVHAHLAAVFGHLVVH